MILELYKQLNLLWVKVLPNQFYEFKLLIIIEVMGTTTYQNYAISSSQGCQMRFPILDALANKASDAW
jgi:hypothetical protein